MGHHPDDLSPFGLRRNHPKKDPLADRRFVGKCFRGQRLINYEQLSIGLVVVFGEGSSCQQLRAHRFEVAG